MICGWPLLHGQAPLSYLMVQSIESVSLHLIWQLRCTRHLYLVNERMIQAHSPLDISNFESLSIIWLLFNTEVLLRTSDKGNTLFYLYPLAYQYTVTSLFHCILWFQNDSGMKWLPVISSVFKIKSDIFYLVAPSQLSYSNIYILPKYANQLLRDLIFNATILLSNSILYSSHWYTIIELSTPFLTCCVPSTCCQSWLSTTIYHL